MQFPYYIATLTLYAWFLTFFAFRKHLPKIEKSMAEPDSLTALRKGELKKAYVYNPLPESISNNLSKSFDADEDEDNFDNSEDPNGDYTMESSMNDTHDDSVTKPLPVEIKNPTDALTKPVYSYAALIGLALRSSKNGKLSVSEIYDFIHENFPWYRNCDIDWKNAIRTNLSTNDCYVKVMVKSSDGSYKKHGQWTVAIDKHDKVSDIISHYSKVAHRADLPKIDDSKNDADEEISKGDFTASTIECDVAYESAEDDSMILGV